MTTAARTAAMRSAAGVPDGLSGPRRIVAVGAISLGTILTTVDGPIVSVALPTLARDLAVTPASVVLVVTVYQLVLIMALLPCSALGDRIGNRATYQWGQAIFVVATIFCFFARSLPFLVLVRAFQALGAAAALSVSAAMIRSVYPAAQLGRGLSLNTVIAAMSASAAPTLGGAILAVAPWPWLFAVVVPFGIVSLLMGRRALPDTPRRHGAYDFLGAGLCAAMFGFAISGLESGVHGDSPVISGALVALAIGIGFVFVRRELGQPRPVLPVDLLRVPTIAASVAGSLAAYTGSMVVMLALPFVLQQTHGFTPIEAGAVLAPFPLVVMVVAPIAGTLSDRVRAGILGSGGMAVAIVGMLSIALLPATPTHLDIVWRVALVGLGQGFFFSPTARHIVGAAPLDRAAAAGALTSTTRGLGQTLGATALAAILATGIGTGAVPALVGAGLALVAGLCSLLSLGGRARHPSPAEVAEAEGAV